MVLGEKRFLRTIKLSNLLSYGSDAEEVKLESLNVLIGYNSTGKSNLIEAIGLLTAAPRDIGEPIREGGGITEWLWKGGEKGSHGPAEIEVTVDYPEKPEGLRYQIALGEVGQRFEIVGERVEDGYALPNAEEKFVYYEVIGKAARFNGFKEKSGKKNRLEHKVLRAVAFDVRQSILSQVKDPLQYPQITYLGRRFGEMKLYREWEFGRYTPPRLPQKPDSPSDFLMADASNLGLVLNDLQHHGEAWKQFNERLQQFYPLAREVTVRILGGTVQVNVQEKGLRDPVPATRLSDGLLRYMALLSILCHPSPPPLVCLEEPELGLHPDALGNLAELLIEASHRTQLIVTTHSDILVSAFSEVPEAVLVCERDEAGTHLRRLEREPLAAWLERYTLGELWLKGEIGGTRW